MESKESRKQESLSRTQRHEKLLQQVMKAVQDEFPKSRLFKAPVGVFYAKRDDHYYRLSVGTPGQADLNGWITIKGRAIRLEIEVKSGNARLSKVQKTWQAICLKMGVIHIVARSPQQALGAIHSRLGQLEPSLG